MDFNKLHFRKPLAIILLLLIVACIACNDRTENTLQNTTADQSALKSTLSAKQIEERIDKGALVFKNNCARCHCAPHSSCEGGPGFKNFPPDSLNYFAAFVKDSKTLKENGDVYAGKIYKETNGACEHVFKKTLKDEEIDDVVLSLCVAFNKH